MEMQNFMEQDNSGVNAGPRVLVYLLLDVSGSMCGPAIQAVNEGVEFIARELRGVPEAVEMAHISIITFGSNAQVHTPLTPVTNFHPVPLNCGGGTDMAGALNILNDQLNKEFRPTFEGQARGDYKPAVFLLTDGAPNDLNAAIEASRALQNRKRGHSVGTFLALGCGPDVNEQNLKQIAPNVALMHNMNSDNIKAFFKWVSASIAVASRSASKAAGRTADVQTDAPAVPQHYSREQVFKFELKKKIQ
jgi:uncharacterized protein YegL